MTAKKILWKSVLGATNTLGNKLDLSKTTLITIGFSHFSERARWLLDLTPLSYEEDRHLPAVHLARTMSPEVDGLCRVQMPGIIVDENDKQLRRKEKTSVPKLVLPVSQLPAEFLPQIKAGSKACVIKDGSRGISRFVTHVYGKELGYLFPSSLSSKINGVEEVLEHQLAPAVTTFAFGNFLLCDRNAFSEDNRAARKLFINTCSQSNRLPAIQRYLFSTLGESLFAPAMIQGNGITAADTARARKDIFNVFEHVENIRTQHGCADDSMHMFNTVQPTLADISFASFAAPLLLPPQASHLFFDREEIQKLRSTAPGCAQYLDMSDMLLEKYASARAILRMYTQAKRRDSL